MALRVDQAMVERGLARSRSLARRLIEAGAVSIRPAGPGPDGAEPVVKPSRLVGPEERIEVAASDESRFASRAGAKLDAALGHWQIACEGACVLDVGMSTGGFADCLLARGARRVIGIEVGHGQLAAALAANPRVRCFEHTHVRDVDPAWLARQGLAAFGFVVSDLSFISSLSLLAHLAPLAVPGATLVMLVKPQFELGPQAIDARGLVRRGADLAALRTQAFALATAGGWQARDWQPSRLTGTDGNQEFFLHAVRAGTETH